MCVCVCVCVCVIDSNFVKNIARNARDCPLNQLVNEDKLDLERTRTGL